MAISNFVITVVGISAVALLMRSDIRNSSAMVRRNLKQIRGWLEESAAVADSKPLPKPEPPKGTRGKTKSRS